MAYNQRYFYRRVIAVQELVLLYKKQGVSQKYIYQVYIESQYQISYSTYNSWLAIPAKRNLKRLEEQQAAEPMLF